MAWLKNAPLTTTPPCRILTLDLILKGECPMRKKLTFESMKILTAVIIPLFRVAKSGLCSHDHSFFVAIN